MNDRGCSMNRYTSFFLLIIALSILGCASTPSSPPAISPSALIANGDSFDGEMVVVGGWIESGFERHRIWDNEQAQQSGETASCVGLAIPVEMESDSFDLTYVTITGRFSKQVPNRTIVLGGCNNDAVLYVDQIRN